MSIKLTNAALEEKEDEEIVLRGSLDPASLKELKVGNYQREVLPNRVLNGLADAVAHGRTPDVILGMRGEHFTSRNNNDFFLQDDVYIIDGVQRIESGKRLMELGKGTPQLGALVYFGSSEKFEREQFNALNTKSVKLSPNIILRNMRQENEAVGQLYALCHDKNFALYQRVTWHQRAARGELISATVLVKTACRLHMFVGTRTGLGNSLVTALGPTLEEVSKTLGRGVLRANMYAFYDTIEAAFGLKAITYKDRANQTKYVFLTSLASVFAKHADFWSGHQDNRLVLSRELLKKLSTFAMNDPHVSSLCTGGSMANHLLQQVIVDHLNKGKRTGHLKRRVLEDEAPPPAAEAAAKAQAPLPLTNGDGRDVAA
jgi:hypothetical protein